MPKPILILLTLLAAAGCKKEFVYDAPVVPKIVVNAMLNPDSTIRIDLWASKKADGTGDFDRLVGARLVLSEDGAVILDTQSSDKAVTLDYYPKPGATYSITVTADGYAPVSASTAVPHAATFDCRHEKTVEAHWYSAYRFYHIEEAAIPADAHSLWVAVDQVPDPAVYDLPENYTFHYGRSSPWEYKIPIYTTAPFADQFNCEEDVTDAAYKGSVKQYNDGLRVAAGNVNKVFPLTFSVLKEVGQTYAPDDYNNWENWGYDDDGEWVNLKYGKDALIFIKVDQRVALIAASKEYDLYYKSLFQFSQSQAMNELIIGSRRYSVWSNVKGGAGIFGAYNAQCNEQFDFNQ